MENVSHSVDLYTIGKGILQFDRFDSDGLPTGLRDLGNAPNFTLTPSEDSLEHFSSREGIKTLDLEVSLIRKITGKFTLDEYDRENLRLALFGATGAWAINLLTAGTIEGTLDFVGTNDVGPRFHVEIWKAKLKPVSEINFISEGWGAIDFEFTVQKDITHVGEEYGKITLIGES